MPPVIELRPGIDIEVSIPNGCRRDENSDDDLRLLFAPGSSLGGAQTQGFRDADRDGHLAIAKFPKEDDDYAIGTMGGNGVLRLAEMAGIGTAVHSLDRIAGKAVMLSGGYDRDAT